MSGHGWDGPIPGLRPQPRPPPRGARRVLSPQDYNSRRAPRQPRGPCSRAHVTACGTPAVSTRRGAVGGRPCDVTPRSQSRGGEQNCRLSNPPPPPPAPPPSSPAAAWGLGPAPLDRLHPHPAAPDPPRRRGEGRGVCVRRGDPADPAPAAAPAPRAGGQEGGASRRSHARLSRAEVRVTRAWPRETPLSACARGGKGQRRRLPGPVTWDRAGRAGDGAAAESGWRR